MNNIDCIDNYYGSIYGLRSPSNKWYIGQTTLIDPIKYIHNTYRNASGGNRTKIHSAIMKYGFESFDVKIFIYLFDKESLDITERLFIEELDSINAGYNCREGGGNGKLTQETKDKIGKANFGRKHPEEVKLRMSLSRKKYLNETNKEIISKSAERYEYILQSPEMELIKTSNLHKFSKEHGLNSNHLGDRGFNKKWRLISKTPLSLITN